MSEQITAKLLQNLPRFTGTEQYYRLNLRVLLTDGTKYLATEGMCFWLMDVISSYLPGYKDTFGVATLKREEGDKATFSLDDGNGNIFATQHIDYTDFPLSEIKLYVSFDGEHWVIMLQSEY